MSDFDPLRAKREELTGFVDVAKILREYEHRTEEAMARAEKELNVVRKISGVVRIYIDQIKADIAKLETQYDVSRPAEETHAPR